MTASNSGNPRDGWKAPIDWLASTPVCQERHALENGTTDPRRPNRQLTPGVRIGASASAGMSIVPLSARKCRARDRGVAAAVLASSSSGRAWSARRRRRTVSDGCADSSCAPPPTSRSPTSASVFTGVGCCQDWQLRQAAQALRIYFVDFLQRTDWHRRPVTAVVDEQGRTSPLAALEQLRSRIRNRHLGHASLENDNDLRSRRERIAESS